MLLTLYLNLHNKGIIDQVGRRVPCMVPLRVFIKSEAAAPPFVSCFMEVRCQPPHHELEPALPRPSSPLGHGGDRKRWAGGGRCGWEGRWRIWVETNENDEPFLGNI